MSDQTDREIQDAKHEAATSGAQPESQYIEALLEERRGYETHGRDDRVAEVDEQLAARGHTEAAAARGKAAPKGVKGRAADPGDQQTA
jgi:hypothetical protein